VRHVIGPFLVSALLAASSDGLLAIETAVTDTDGKPTVSIDVPPAHAGDAARGANRSAELYCAACHGVNGNSESRGIPSLAGQDAVYMAKQLMLYRSGERANTDMQPIAAPLSDADIADLAAHFAAQTPQKAQASIDQDSSKPVIDTTPHAIAYTVFGTGDMNAGLGLWADAFGMEVVARREGADPELARAWGLPADGIADQALLLTPGVSRGGVHLVRFTNPGPPVREGAATTALLPKNIDVAVDDIRMRYSELEAAGYTFRSEPRPMMPGIYEVQMAGPDDINIDFVDAIPGSNRKLSGKGFGPGVMYVMISADFRAEADILQRLLGLQPGRTLHLRGPEIEKIIGLPPGGGLDGRILGDPNEPYGTLQVSQYSGALNNENRYPRAKAPARGMLSLTYFVDDLSPWLALAGQGEITDLGKGAGIYGPGRMVTFTTPAGLRVDVVEKADTQ